jgi:hypothetical protein
MTCISLLPRSGVLHYRLLPEDYWIADIVALSLLSRERYELLPNDWYRPTEHSRIWLWIASFVCTFLQILVLHPLTLLQYFSNTIDSEYKFIGKFMACKGDVSNHLLMIHKIGQLVYCTLPACIHRQVTFQYTGIFACQGCLCDGFA